MRRRNIGVWIHDHALVLRHPYMTRSNSSSNFARTSLSPYNTNQANIKSISTNITTSQNDNLSKRILLGIESLSKTFGMCTRILVHLFNRWSKADSPSSSRMIPNILPLYTARRALPGSRWTTVVSSPAPWSEREKVRGVWTKLFYPKPWQYTVRWKCI